MKVIKRDGREVKFNPSKIHDAVIAAAVANNIAISEDNLIKITDSVIKKIEAENKDSAEVEEIQDYVVESLVSAGFKTLARKYQAYRVERNKVRERGSGLMTTIYKIGIETDRDNANVGNNFSAKLLRIASESNK
ncbi:MAG: ATP cone domain-containing protein [Mycoplasmoidaceae bacterium]|nr:ATP cone domain-containing protein [Mycoplasmoidaceae bacterium]